MGEASLAEVRLCDVRALSDIARLFRLRAWDGTLDLLVERASSQLARIRSCEELRPR